MFQIIGNISNCKKLEERLTDARQKLQQSQQKCDKLDIENKRLINEINEEKDRPGAVQKFKTARAKYSVKDILCYFGGLEMAMAVGAMLRAAELRMVILVDGFIMTNCMLAASKLDPNVLQYAVFGHQGDESGHKILLEYLHAKPLLNLGLPFL